MRAMRIRIRRRRMGAWLHARTAALLRPRPPPLPPEAGAARLRRAYGFEEVALVPGAVTADPAEVELATTIAGQRLEIPFIAAAMDAVADPDFAVRMSRHGGLAFINLEGLYTRYDDASAIIERVAAAASGAG